MKDILTDIIANKRIEVAKAREHTCVEALLEQIEPCPRISMHDALATSSSGIIAEFKRKSPSKGWIHADARIEDVAPLYQQGGATAMSVLTDEVFFGGRLADLSQARRLVGMPLLRKDFIIDELQLVQAAAAGANAVLLIAAALTPEQCGRLAERAVELSLEVLLEIHSEAELRYVTDAVRMVGVNNRNLGTFHTDVSNSLRIAECLPHDKLLISESGISEPKTVKLLRQAGFRGFLIGESFMKNESPGEALADFIQQLQ